MQFTEGTLEAMYCISFFFILYIKVYRDLKELMMLKKKFFKDLPWNKGCDPQSWYRTFGPFVYDSDFRILEFRWKNKSGEWTGKVLWCWWR